MIEGLASAFSGLLNNELNDLKKKIRTYGITLINAFLSREEEGSYDFKRPVLIKDNGEEEAYFTRIYRNDIHPSMEDDSVNTPMALDSEDGEWFIEGLDFGNLTRIVQRLIEERELTGKE